MIENNALMLIYLMIGIPCVLGAIYAILTRPSKYYYKIKDGRVQKIRIWNGK